MYSTRCRKSRGTRGAGRGHALPDPVHVSSTIQLVILVVRVRGIALRDDEARRNGPCPFFCRERRKREPNVVPIHQLMDKVTEQVAMQFGAQQGSSYGGLRAFWSGNLPRQSNRRAPCPEVFGARFAHAAQ